jgi:hypothetical protein
MGNSILYQNGRYPFMAIKTILVGLIIACAVLFPFVLAETPTNSAAPVVTDTPLVIAPTMTASMATTTIIRGNSIAITGTETGARANIGVWIIGKNQGNRFEITPNTGGNFVLTLEPAIFSLYDDGTYYVIVQHPGLNGEFDIALDNSKGYLKNGQIKQTVKNLEMPYSSGSLRGEDARWTIMNSLVSKDDLMQEFTITINTPKTTSPTPTPTPTATPTVTQTTQTPTPTPTSTPVPTTIVTTLPTTQPIETLTANPTQAPQMRITVAPVIQEKSLVESNDGKSVDEKLDEINQKVDNQQIQLDNQQSILDQIMTFLKSIFNWS